MRVVALGGGHGLAATLQAVRRYAGDVCAIVSVADDGGSSGRLRQDLGMPAPGDLRRCLVALADPDSLWTHAFEHRFEGGELEGHAFGNLVIAGPHRRHRRLRHRARGRGPSARRGRPRAPRHA